MAMARVWGGLAVFGAGVVVGGLTLHSLSSPVSTPEAQRRALALLDKPPVLTSIGDNKIVSAARRISPAVVSIDTIGRVKQQDENGNTFYVQQEVKGKGSGVVLTPDGYLVTNDHVIEGASRVRVTFADGQWRFARLIGHNPERDIAVLRVDAEHLACAELGDSDKLQVGETVLAVGNPMGLGSSVTSGIISALDRRNLQIDAAHNLDGAIQTDAAINRGNSGGALANINGQLIGLNTAILSVGQGGGNIGLGFALPINAVRRIARELIASHQAEPHTARKAWLGIQARPIPENIRVSLGLPARRGVEIVRTLPETPASLAGLQNDDILLRIDGKAITGQQDITAILAARKPGERASLHILRPSDGHEHDFSVMIQEHPEAMPPLP